MPQLYLLFFPQIFGNKILSLTKIKMYFKKIQIINHNLFYMKEKCYETSDFYSNSIDCFFFFNCTGRRDQKGD